MTRLENWPLELTRFIEERRAAPFVWGSNDCCLFAADWVLRCTGVDLAATFRGTYSSPLVAHRIINESGGIETLWSEHAEKMGAKRIPSAQAWRGDVAIRDGGKGDCLGVVVGTQAAFVSESGLLFYPVESCRCWRI